MRHVVMFSGGMGSWATAKRVAERHGTADLTLLFADTKVEEPDLYRFLDEAAGDVGGQLVKVADGRTPFEVFHDTRFLGNARLANCSKFLKQQPCRAWLEANCDPAATTLYVGIDWSEQHRLPAIEKGWAPWQVKAPLCEQPFISKRQMFEALANAGIEPPAAYTQGAPHNNCLAQGCVRGGQAYWQFMLRTRREAYLRSEAQEQELRDYLDADVAILRDRADGNVTPVTLRAFRERLEGAPTAFDAEEWGACDCLAAATPIDALFGDEVG